MTFLFGSEKSQDDCSFRTSLRNEISLAKESKIIITINRLQLPTISSLHFAKYFFIGREREDLIQFERGLRHVFLYDIETHAGEEKVMTIFCFLYSIGYFCSFFLCSQFNASDYLSQAPVVLLYSTTSTKQRRSTFVHPQGRSIFSTREPLLP